ncbi:ribonuclease H-like domain-containing protein [Tanacetum coccineum]
MFELNFRVGKFVGAFLIVRSRLCSGRSKNSLDAGNPLHLQTNDNSSSALINVKLIGCENYRVWATAMKIALQARNKMGFVDGTCVKSAYVTSVPLSNQWERCNVVVLSWLLSSIYEDLYLSQVYSENAAEEFDILTKFSPCTCNAKTELGKHQQLMKLMQFLMGLDDVYQPIRSSLLTQPELPDVKDAFVIVCKEESHKGLGSTSGVQKPQGFSNSNNKDVSSNNVEVQTPNVSLPFTNDQIAKLISLIGEKDNFGVQANMAGANQHITNSTKNMTNFVDISELNITVGYPNGTIAKTNHVGNLKLTNNVVLFDVLVIPEYTVRFEKKNVLGTGSESGGLYMFDIYYDFSRAVWVYLIKSKDEVFGYFVDFVNLISNQFLKRVKVIRSDNGTEFINNKMDVFLRDKGIVHQTSCAYTPQQNGIAERKHIHLLNVARSLLFQGGIPLCFWTDCVLTATYLINRLPSSVLAGKSPFSMLYGREPSLSHLRCFGCLCFSSILNNSDKFSSKSEKCILIGYSSSKKAYKLLSLENRSYIFSRDVKFYETIFPYKMKSNNKSFDNVINNEVNNKNFFDLFESGHQNISSPNDDGEGPSDDAGEVIVDHQSTDTAEEQPFDDDVHTASSMDDNPISEGNVPCVQNVPTYDSSNRTDDDNPVCVNTRRSSRVSKLPDKLNDFVLDNKVNYVLNKYANHNKLSTDNSCFFSNLNKTVEPTCYNEAVKDINLVQAVNNEMKALYLNNTWTLTELPINRKAIGSKWVYKIKYKSDGEVERYKARVVAKGFGQKEGVDYEEIFSPVVKMSTAPRQWNKKLVETLTKAGFWQSKNDHSLFVKNKDGIFLALLVYADDIIITGNNNDEISKFKTFLNQKFKIKDLGELKNFPGIEVLKIKNGLCLNQRKYCIELLHEYGILACKPVATPMLENGILSHKETENDKLLKNITSYQKIVGKLIYLCNTRPDIAFSVYYLSQHMHSPLQSYFKAALRVLRYLKSAPGTGIIYTKSSTSSISAYADSDWAKCKMTRRSISGYCVFVCGGLVSWKSKKQATLSRSFTEAEYISMAFAVCEVMWIVKILKDLKFSSNIPAILFCDNSSAIQIAANPVMHEKTKHFDIDVHLIREKVAFGLIKTIKVDSEKQIADILTKGTIAAFSAFLALDIKGSCAARVAIMVISQETTMRKAIRFRKRENGKWNKDKKDVKIISDHIVWKVN